MKISKFAIGDLLPIGLTFIILGIAIAYGLSVMGNVRTTIATDACAGNANYNIYNAASSTVLCYNSTGGSEALNSTAFDATNNAITGVAKIPTNLPTIITVVLASIIIGILVTYLVVREK